MTHQLNDDLSHLKALLHELASRWRSNSESMNFIIAKNQGFFIQFKTIVFLYVLS